MPGERYFSREMFSFLDDLAANNERPWFQDNKHRYERYVKEPSLHFIEDFGPHLEKVTKHFVADPSPVGGSLFRIYRDTRFSKDKRPYKTTVGIRFSHELAKDVHAPGYYLHLASEGCFVGAGIWHPDSKALGSIRAAIVEDPAAWKRARSAKRFKDGWKLEGDSLKRAPKGVDPEHPLIEDLRRKDFIGVKRLTKKSVLGGDFMSEFTATCKEAVSLNRFLCGALGLSY